MGKRGIVADIEMDPKFRAKAVSRRDLNAESEEEESGDEYGSSMADEGAEDGEQEISEDSFGGSD